MSDSQGAIIETKTASLETMSVTIQALHVNGKQMTLAVFRQLPEFVGGWEHMWKVFPDAALWGIVRYKMPSLCWDPHNGMRSRGTWIVFSANGALQRLAWVGKTHDLPSLPQLFIAV